MSRFFVEKQPIAVHEFDDMDANDPMQNTVWVKPKMNFQDRAVYQDSMWHASTDETGSLQRELRIMQAEVMLLKINIVRWDGPDFRDERGIPRLCTPDAIEGLDSTEPFWQKVLGELNRRNRPRREVVDDPNEVTASPTSAPAILPGSEEADKPPVETMILRSSAQNGTTGRRIKSVN